MMASRAWPRLAARVVSIGLLAACASSSSHTAAIVWSGGPGWRTVAIQSFPGPEAMGVSGLACAGPDLCEAAGTYTQDKKTVPFVMTGLTSRQGPALITLRMPAGAVITDKIDLACASPRYCVMVGTYEAVPAHYLAYGFIATESDGRWSAAQTVPPPAGSEGGIEDLSGVACTGPGDCVVVGSALNSAYVQVPIVVTESGGIWRRAVYLSPPSDFNVNQGSGLLSVSCSSAGSCVAVGQYGVKSGLVDWPMAVIESGGRWQRVQKIPLPADANQNKKVGAGNLSSVSCASGGTCLAVGDYAAGAAGTDRGLAITEAHGQFGQIAERPQELDTVTCAPGFCASGDHAGQVVSYSGGRWSPLEPIRPSASIVKDALGGAGLGVAMIACFADRRCIAASAFGGVRGPTFLLLSTHG